MKDVILKNYTYFLQASEALLASYITMERNKIFLDLFLNKGNNLTLCICHPEIYKKNAADYLKELGAIRTITKKERQQMSHFINQYYISVPKQFSLSDTIQNKVLFYAYMSNKLPEEIKQFIQNSVEYIEKWITPNLIAKEDRWYYAHKTIDENNNTIIEYIPIGQMPAPKEYQITYLEYLKKLCTLQIYYSLFVYEPFSILTYIENTFDIAYEISGLKNKIDIEIEDIIGIHCDFNNGLYILNEKNEKKLVLSPPNRIDVASLFKNR